MTAERIVYMAAPGAAPITVTMPNRLASNAEAVAGLRRLEQQLGAIVPSWSMAPVVAAYQAMRGASFLVAVTIAAEIGDLRRFDTPRQLMAFLGLVPRERSSGDMVRRAGLTLDGNGRARRVLVEAAWSYRHPARISETLRPRLEACRNRFATSPGRRRSGSVRVPHDHVLSVVPTR
jgi:transposase